MSFVDDGPLGIGLLRPQALFGLAGLDQITHTMFWSLLANVGLYIALPLFSRPGAVQTAQAVSFVDVFTHGAGGPRLWRAHATVDELTKILRRFLGAPRAEEILEAYRRRRGPTVKHDEADADYVQFAETELAAAIGAASARAVVASVVHEEPLATEDIMRILHETSEAIAHSREMEQKSRELEAATRQLREANERLKELDRLKDDFVSTVSHELRTPLTSIRAFSEILFDAPDLDAAKRTEFVGIILKESERLTRLINDLLDFAKLESGRTEWHIATIDLRSVVADAVSATGQLFRDAGVRVECHTGTELALVRGDHDRLMQVLINLLSNAAKFCPSGTGHAKVSLRRQRDGWRVDVEDNGPGISPRDQEIIFEKFRQAGDKLAGKPPGTGLGLPISRHIVEHLGGRLWVSSTPGQGAVFSFSLPEQISVEASPPVAVGHLGS